MHDKTKRNLVQIHDQPWFHSGDNCGRLWPECRKITVRDLTSANEKHKRLAVAIIRRDHLSPEEPCCQSSHARPRCLF